MLKNLLKLLHLNLVHFVGFCVCVYSFVLLYVSPLLRQLQNNIWGTISRTAGWEMNTKIIKTEISLHLNLEGFFFLFFILFYFILFIYFFSFTYFLFLFLSLFLSFFYFQSSLCLSNAFSAYGWLVNCLSLFTSLKRFLFVSLFCFFFYLIICFSLFL
jgi:hypothetical protein